MIPSNPPNGWLLTNSREKDYKLQKQWVVFELSPENAIVYVDSALTVTRNGRVQLQLPMGKHPYRVVSPFHIEMDGILEVSDTTRSLVKLSLQPVYSFLTVITPLEGGEIQVDGKTIGYTEATSGRLLDGTHRLTVMREDVCWYETDVKIEKADKKTVILAQEDLYPRWSKKKADYIKSDEVAARSIEYRSVARQQPDDTDAILVKNAPVTITSPNDSTEIWVNRELKGIGKWVGNLPIGFYAITTRTDGIESVPRYLWVEDELPIQLDLSATMADYGYLSIHSNEVDADIYINGIASGRTPTMTGKLMAGKTYSVKLSKVGFKDVIKQVTVIGNTLTDVELKMKKLKKK